MAATLALTACPRPPLEFGPDGPISDGTRLVDLLGKNAETLNGLKASAKVSVESATQKGAVDELVSAARPAKLHLETLDFFGKPAALLVTTGDRFSFFDAQRNEVTRGPATTANLARILPLSLAPAEVVALLLGAPRLIAQATPHIVLDEERRAYVLSLSGPEVTQILVVGTRDLRVIQMDLQGPSGYRVDYDKFEDFAGRALARRIRLIVPAERATVEVSLSDVEINPVEDPGLFAFAPPTGARVIEVDGEGRTLPEGRPGLR